MPLQSVSPDGAIYVRPGWVSQQYETQQLPLPTATANKGLGGLYLAASTGMNGYTLVNNTGSIISWVAPNDGQLHRVAIFGVIHVSSTETGGLVQLQYYGPWTGSTLHAGTVFNAGLGTDTSGQVMTNEYTIIIAPNTTVTLAQTSALSIGAAICWAEIWAS